MHLSPTPLPVLPSHPLRERLNSEMHARPPLALTGPTWVSHLAMLHNGGAEYAAEEAHLKRLCELTNSAFCPVIDGNHWVMDAGDLRLKWERHNEFSTYTFFRSRQPDDSDATTALEAFPADWVHALPGQLLVASHLELRRGNGAPPNALLDQLTRNGAAVVASRVADGAAWVVSDFLLHEGSTRFLLIDEGLRHRQAGRTVQRLLEIETYRMMALLAFPVAKDVGRLLGRAENELADLMDNIVAAGSADDEREVLGRLTRLAAEIERSVARTAFRFGAATAYYRLVQQRIEDLREQRIEGFPPIREFMERRLAPALNTVDAIARRQGDISDRVARKSQLLRTRVDIELERQNQELLSQMNRRAKLQLRLQETVEGLSVVAITYYGSQLVHYLAKGAKSVVPGLSPEVATALAIPAIAGFVALGLRRMRRALASEESGGH